MNHQRGTRCDGARAQTSKQTTKRTNKYSNRQAAVIEANTQTWVPPLIDSCAAACAQRRLPPFIVSHSTTIAISICVARIAIYIIYTNNDDVYTYVYMCLDVHIPSRSGSVLAPVPIHTCAPHADELANAYMSTREEPPPADTYMRPSLYTYICTYTRMHACMYVCVHLRNCMQLCTWMSICLHMSVTIVLRYRLSSSSYYYCTK
eukprot:GHVU01004719.1.p1 GENE.GHVU01004719.1~~GHVU01004719.1.p1  ORF type:complete len:205 (+),score=4.76 GHVU01004719.1:126-740(+)